MGAKLVSPKFEIEIGLEFSVLKNRTISNGIIVGHNELFELIRLLSKVHIRKQGVEEMKLLKEFYSISKKGRKYQVIEDDEGNIKCDCPGFTYRGECRHIEQVEEEKKK